MVKKKKTIFIAGSAIICVVTVLLLYFLLIAFGVIQIRSNKLIIKANDVTKEYDGITAECDGYTIVEGQLEKTHRIVPTYSGSLTDAGTKEVQFSVQILDENDTDVSSKYELELQKGLITINPRLLEIKTEDQQKEYDGTPLTYQHYMITNGTLLEGHTLAVNMPSSITTYGKVVNECIAVIYDSDNKEVTKNYNIVYNKGYLEIIKRKLLIQTNSVEKVYDGLPLEDHNFIIKEGKLRDGDTIKCKFKGSITDIGSTENIAYDITIFNNQGIDVTNMYHIETEFGTLTVNKIPLTIQSESLTKVYDKTPLKSDLSNANAYTIIGNIVSSHNITVELNNSITEIGNIENTITVYIKDENGRDVTDKYELDLKPGELKVLPYIGGSGEITSKPINPQDILFCQVYSKENKRVYLRDKSYGNYINGNWQEAYEYVNSKNTSPLLYSGLAIKNSGRDLKPSTINVNMIEKNLANFSCYNCYDVRLDSYNDCKLDFGRSDAFTMDYYDYNIFSEGLVSVPDKYRVEEENYRKYVYSNYLDISNEMREVIQLLIDEFKIKRTDDLLKDILYIKYLVRSTFEYNIDFPRDEEIKDPIKNFVTFSRIGNCQHFASVATLLFRYLGIPARYVTGYLVECKADQYVEVTDRAGHAWTEVYIDGYGWVKIEASNNIKEEDEKVIISITANSLIKEYDGIALTSDDYTMNVISGEFNPNWNLNLEIVGSQTEPGTSLNKCVLNGITDENGNDISDRVIVYLIEGTLTVEKIKLLVESSADKKQYDGTPLTNPEYTVEGKAIHNLSIKTTGSQTEVGVSFNTLEISITDELGNDASKYYELKVIEGPLEVYNLEIPLIKVTSDEAGSFYLRDKSYGDYNGHEFINDIDPYNENSKINPLDFVSQYLIENNTKSTKLTIEPLVIGLPFLTPYYRKDIDVENKVHNDITYGGILNKTYEINFFNFNALENLDAKIGPKYLDDEIKYSKYVHATYLSLPSDTKLSLLKIAEENDLDAKSSTLIDDVKKYIRTAAVYDDRFVFPACTDMVVDFLTTIKKGVCRHYAAAATAMYRALGVPARYVTGFRADLLEPGTTEVKVGHAWVEVYIDELGWIPVEVTGSNGSGGGFGDGEGGAGGGAGGAGGGAGGAGGGAGGEGGDLTDQIIEGQVIKFIPKDEAVKYSEGMEPLKPKTLKDQSIFKTLEKNGYTYKYELLGEISKPGKAVSKVRNVQIFDKDGNDVTKKFRIVTEEGLLHIYLEIITFKLKNVEKIYDGEKYTPSEEDCIHTGNLASPSHKMEYSLSPFTQKVGTFIIRPKIIIRNEIGQLINDQYKFVYEGGIIKINPRLLEIEAGSSQKYYDGIPLIWNKYEIIGGDGLLPNHKIIVTIEGKQTEFGISSNVITKVIIKNLSGKDVSKNYTFKLYNGQLIVVP